MRGSPARRSSCPSAGSKPTLTPDDLAAHEHHHRIGDGERHGRELLDEEHGRALLRSLPDGVREALRSDTIRVSAYRNPTERAMIAAITAPEARKIQNSLRVESAAYAATATATKRAPARVIPHLRAAVPQQQHQDDEERDGRPVLADRRAVHQNDAQPEQRVGGARAERGRQGADHGRLPVKGPAPARRRGVTGR
ncbi:MAG: hypothetical protein OXG52_03340 [bacterium]|nr:hypothetical protein [bacterium]